MKTRPLSQAKTKLSSLVKAVERHNDEIVITKNGRPAAVLMSIDAFEGWKETLAVSADRGLMRDIRRGLAAFKARRARRYTLDELFR